MSEFFKKRETSEFFKKFLLEDPRRFSPTGKYVALAAFGKHPGWDDHVEDLGLETESLNLTKTLLYINGIGGQIDSGSWEKLDAAQQLPGFKHVFLWRRGNQILLGRLWSSSDGKGRKRYPMAVCAHFMGVTLGWALPQGLRVLAELEQGCLQTNSAEEVRRLLERQRAALRECIQSGDGAAEYAPVAPEVLHRILHPIQEAGREGFLRVLYLLQSQFGSFAPGVFNPRANTAGIRPRQLRVRAAGSSLEESLLFWSRFFSTQVDSAAPLLFAAPLDADWIDITVGEPESHEFFCLRAGSQAIPTVNEVPYTLEASFREGATQFLDSFESGVLASMRPMSASSSGSETPTKTGWRKWLGLGGGTAATLVALLCKKWS